MRRFTEGDGIVLYSHYSVGYTNLHMLKFAELYTKKSLSYYMTILK